MITHHIPDLVKIRVSLEDRYREYDDVLKCAWEIPNESEEIVCGVKRRNVDELGTKIREKLTDFVQTCSNPEQMQRYSKSKLKDVARYGRELYCEIFRDVSNVDIGSKISNYLEKLHDSIYLIISVPKDIHVPWGLIFSGDPELLSEEDGIPKPEDYSDFWSMKYLLCTIFKGARIRYKPERFIERDCFRLLPALNNQAYNRAIGVLQSKEKDIIQTFFTAHGPITTKKELFKRWPLVRDYSGLLYFFCHSSGTKLEFSDSTAEKLTANDIYRHLLCRNPDTINFVFFNGCMSATGPNPLVEKVEDAFIDSLASSGFKGFIGTEAPVPDVFALKFGFEFLQHFLEGKKTMREVLQDLRKQHWPMSLIYAAYCDTSFYLTPDSPITCLCSHHKQLINFSFDIMQSPAG
jgi:hypothetical protein